MGLLKEAVNEQAYLKAALFGEAGTGKTTTAAYMAMAISKGIGGNKPVGFFETESGSDYLVEKFKKEGIKLSRIKSHSLKDLIDVAKEAEQECSALIVDSITHVWNELCEAKLRSINEFLKKKNRQTISKLEFQHWADIKRTWAQWTTVYLNSNLHIIVCGRAGNTYEFNVNDETGKKELQQTGTKMKAEGEFGYEPALVIEMERVQKGPEKGSGWRHRAVVLKDKSDSINGLAFEFEKPRSQYKAGDYKKTFKPFEPVLKCLNIGGQQITTDETRKSDEMFQNSDGDSDNQHRGKLVKIALEEIEAAILLVWPGQDAKSKVAKLNVIEAAFGQRSWVGIEARPLEELTIAARAFRVFAATHKNTEVASEDIPKFMNEAFVEVTSTDRIGKPISEIKAAVADDLPPNFNVEQGGARTMETN